MSSKAVLRTALKKTRGELPAGRREKASLTLFTQLLPILDQFNRILSFASFGSEIDTSLLNLYLARTGRLLLPKMEGNTLKIFQVVNPATDLLVGSFDIFEPNPKICLEVEPHTLQIVLVPALGFDQTNHRLGYGKGFYDRFLKNIPCVQTLGIGFKEQFVETLPSTHADIPLEKVSLF